VTAKRRGWNANLPTRWLTEPAIRDLSGDALATHVMALIYGIEHENDGAIATGALRWLLPPNSDAASVTAELVTAGLWDATAEGFQIVNWSATQTTRAEMERTRKQNRDRQRQFQKRQKEAAEGAAAENPDSDSRMTNALVTQPPEISTDQARTDKASTDEGTAEVTDWYTAPIPGSEPRRQVPYCEVHGLECDLDRDDCEWSYV
jgi:hypothetical protein